MSNITIDVKNDAMLGRINDSVITIKLYSLEKALKEKDKEIKRLNNKLVRIRYLIDRTPRQTSKEKAYIMLKSEIAEVIGDDRKVKETIDDILTELSCKGWQESVHEIEKTLKEKDKEIKRLKQNNLLGKKPNVLFFEEVETGKKVNVEEMIEYLKHHIPIIIKYNDGWCNADIYFENGTLVVKPASSYHLIFDGK